MYSTLIQIEQRNQGKSQQEEKPKKYNLEDLTSNLSNQNI